MQCKDAFQTCISSHMPMCLQEFATVLKNFDIKVTDSELDALVQRYLELVI